MHVAHCGAAKARGALPPSGTPASSGKRGRPKEDLRERTEKAIAEFKAADKDHIRFFGAERKTQMKAWHRFLEQLEAAEDTEEGDELKDVILLKKAVTTIVRLSNAIHKQSNFAVAFTEAVQFVRMEPALDSVPCPDWMAHHAHRSRARAAQDHKAFWDLLDEQVLVTARFQDEEIAQAQIGMVVERCVQIVKEDNGSVKQTLAELLAPASQDDTAVSKAVLEMCQPVYVVVTFDSDACASVRQRPGEVARSVRSRLRKREGVSVSALPCDRPCHDSRVCRGAHSGPAGNFSGKAEGRLAACRRGGAFLPVGPGGGEGGREADCQAEGGERVDEDLRRVLNWARTRIPSSFRVPGKHFWAISTSDKCVPGSAFQDWIWQMLHSISESCSGWGVACYEVNGISRTFAYNTRTLAHIRVHLAYIRIHSESFRVHLAHIRKLFAYISRISRTSRVQRNFLQVSLRLHPAPPGKFRRFKTRAPSGKCIPGAFLERAFR